MNWILNSRISKWYRISEFLNDIELVKQKDFSEQIRYLLLFEYYSLQFYPRHQYCYTISGSGEDEGRVLGPIKKVTRKKNRTFETIESHLSHK